MAHNTTGDKDRKRRKAPQTVVLSSGNKMFQNIASANPTPNIVGKFCTEPPHEQEILSSSRIYGTPQQYYQKQQNSNSNRGNPTEKKKRNRKNPNQMSYLM